MTAKPRIAIVGGGLGGAAAGILLERAGHDVVVYEQAERLVRIGAGIHLGPNVIKVLTHLGVIGRLREIGILAERRLNREWDTGNILFEEPVEEWAAAYGSATLIMHRGDLLEVLASALKPGSLRFGKRLVGLDHAGAATRLSFDDGSSESADVIIGADGVNSRIREILLGPEPPIYTGFVAYRAIFPTAFMGDFRVLADSTKWWSDERHWANEDRHFIIYYLTKARDEIYFVTGSPDPNWDQGVASVPADMKEVKTCYEGFHDEVQRVIDACPQASKWPLLERNPLPLWSRDNIVLLGDACHPMKPHMGQGAGMAIEDAAMLARCIAAEGGDFPAAFKLYEVNRIDRTSRVQEESHRNIWMKHKTDPSWVFAYDAVNVPIVPAGASASASGAEGGCALAGAKS